MNVRDLMVATMSSTLFAYVAILAASVRIKDGITWRIYKLVLVCHTLSSVGALIVVATKPIHWKPDVGSLLVIVFRMLGAFGNVALAYVLWRQTSSGKEIKKP